MYASLKSCVLSTIFPKSRLWALSGHSLRSKLMTVHVQIAAFRRINYVLSAIVSCAGYLLPCFATSLPCSSSVFP